MIVGRVLVCWENVDDFEESKSAASEHPEQVESRTNRSEDPVSRITEKD
jgi:hypothetical protein